MQIQLNHSETNYNQTVDFFINKNVDYIILDTPEYGKLLVCHGHQNGMTTIPDEEIVYNNIFDKVDKILCCFPFQVSQMMSLLLERDLTDKWFFNQCQTPIEVNGIEEGQTIALSANPKGV